MNKHKLIIFDFDGTLVNSSSGIYSTANWVVKQLGYEEVSDLDQLSKFIGPPIQDCFRITYNLEESLIDKACDLFHYKYDKEGIYKAEVFDGIEPVLQELKDRGYILAVASMKYDKSIKIMLKHLKLDQYFDFAEGTNKDGTKLKTVILDEIIEHFKLDKKDAVLVGDTYHDKEAAIDSNIDFLAVSYGFGYGKDSQVSSDMIAMASSVNEILSYIL